MVESSSATSATRTQNGLIVIMGFTLLSKVDQHDPGPETHLTVTMLLSYIIESLEKLRNCEDQIARGCQSGAHQNQYDSKFES